MTSTELRDIRSQDWATDGASAVALLLHGFGSSERDIAGLAQALGLDVPWAALRAPLDLSNGGAAWFEIVTPGDPDAEPVEAATDAIWRWVDANVAAGTPVVPIGFSQGGLMASQLVRTRPQRVAATVVLGGFVLGAVQPADAALVESRPAVFWGRGSEDRVIGVPAISRTSDFLPGHSSLEEHVYPGLAHGISNAEVDDVRAFLTAQVGSGVVAAR
jgi:phospholipase/carboxylesterase